MDNFELLEEIKKYGKENNIPIIEDEGLVILIKEIKHQKFKNILEVGTAIGYSSLWMSQYTKAQIITFERDQEMLKEAYKNIKKANKSMQIKIIDADFLKYDITNLPKFDLIYIDGAKAQYYNFFKHIEKKLSDEGIIIFDNLNFHDYVNNEKKKENISRNLRQLVSKIEKFLIRIKEEKGYRFDFINVGDGIGILRKDNND